MISQIEKLSDNLRENQNETINYVNIINNQGEQTYEEYISNNLQQINNLLSFLLNAKRMKSRKCHFMIKDIIVDKHNLNYLRIQDMEQAIITIIQIHPQYADTVQKLMSEIKSLMGKEGEDVLLQPIFSDIIYDKEDQDMCSIYDIRELSIGLKYSLSLLNCHQHKNIINFIEQVFQILQRQQNFSNCKKEDIIDYIIITKDGHPKLDYFYFLNEYCFKHDQKIFDQEFDQILEQYKPMHFEESFQYKNNLISSKSNVNLSNPFQTQSNQQNQDASYSHSISTFYNSDLLSFYKSEQQPKSTKPIIESNSINSQRSIKIYDDSSILNKIIFQSFDYHSKQLADDETQCSSTISLSNTSNNQCQNKQSDQNSVNFSKSDPEQSQRKHPKDDQASILTFDETQKKILLELIYYKSNQNIKEIIEDFQVKDEAPHINYLKGLGYDQIQINLNAYQTFVSIAKKIFYKHFIRQLIISYEDSPFYYQHFMKLKQEISDLQDEYLDKMSLINRNNPRYIPYNQINHNKNILGDFHNIQISLKEEYLTQGLLENPIRFTDCIRHIECFDLSSLDTLKKIGKCPVCLQFIDKYYPDKYLEVIINFFSKKKKNLSLLNLEDFQNFSLFPYSIESVKCYVENGIVIPQIEWIESKFQDSADEQYPEIPNIVDLEYLYQIIKYNTYEKEIQQLNQFPHLSRNTDHQPILSILQFQPAAFENQFRLSKVFHTLRFMDHPVRNSSQSCTHIDCFDLSDLLANNSPRNFNYNELICPVCSSCFQLEDLVYDKEYMKIINFAEDIFVEHALDKQQYNNIPYALIDIEGNIHYLGKTKQINQIQHQYQNLYSFQDNHQTNQSTKMIEETGGDDNDKDERYYLFRDFQQIIDGVKQDEAYAVEVQDTNSNLTDSSNQSGQDQNDGYKINDNICVQKRLNDEETDDNLDEVFQMSINNNDFNFYGFENKLEYQVGDVHDMFDFDKEEQLEFNNNFSQKSMYDQDKTIDSISNLTKPHFRLPSQSLNDMSKLTIDLSQFVVLMKPFEPSQQNKIDFQNNKIDDSYNLQQQNQLPEMEYSKALNEIPNPPIQPQLLQNNNSTESLSNSL